MQSNQVCGLDDDEDDGILGWEKKNTFDNMLLRWLDAFHMPVLCKQAGSCGQGGTLNLWKREEKKDWSDPIKAPRCDAIHLIISTKHVGCSGLILDNKACNHRLFSFTQSFMRFPSFRRCVRCPMQKLLHFDLGRFTVIVIVLSIRPGRLTDFTRCIVTRRETFSQPKLVAWRISLSNYNWMRRGFV